MPVRREPALLIAFISAVLSLVVAFNVGLSSEQAGLLVGALSALAGLVMALTTRPVAPGVFTGVVAAVAAAVAGFGFEIAPEVIGGINALVLSGLALLTRVQVSPTTAP